MTSVTPNEVQSNDATKPTAGLPADDDEALSRVNECRKQADQMLGDWYDDAKLDFEFYESKQWSDDDIDTLKREERIPVVFNRVAAVVNAICGQEVANRQEARYLPRRVGPVGPADPMNDAVKWARELCNAEDEDSDAFRDQVICGMGWTVMRMDYEGDPDGRIEDIRRDPLLMRWDPSSRRKNLADAKWIQADYPMRKEDIEAQWPDADMDAIATLSKNDRAQPIDTTQNWKYKSGATQSGSQRDEFIVTHHVERRSVKKMRAVDPATQEIKSYSEDEHQQIQDNHASLPDEARLALPLPQFVPVRERVYWEAWTLGGTVLHSGEAPSQKEFCYQCMTCFRERETGFWHGVVFLMRDPQRYANRLMSLMMSILGTGAKGGVLFESGAFANQKKALNDWAKHNSAVELTAGALAAGKVQPKPPAMMPQGAADLMQFAIASIRDVTGVNIELLGQENGNETGVVEDMKTKAGLTILAPVFDAARLYRKRQAVVWAEYLKFISDGRLIRVLGPQGEQFVPLLRNPDSMEFDIVVDESPASRDVKDRTWMALQALIPLWMQGGMPPLPDFLDYAPIPQSLAMTMKQAMQQKAQQPQQPPPNPQMMTEQVRGQNQMQLEDKRHQDRLQELQMEAQKDTQTSAAQIFSDHSQMAADHVYKSQQLAQQGNIDARLAKLEAALGAIQQIVVHHATPQPSFPGPTPTKVPRRFAQ